MWPSGLDDIAFSPLHGKQIGARVSAAWRRRSSVALAVTGKAFSALREHLPEEYKRLLVGGAIFSRMQPDQKAQLIEDLADLVRWFEVVVDACGSILAHQRASV